VSAAPAPATNRTGGQRTAADPGLSAWVAASAGAGKTQVLSDRVLRLLLAGARPEGILCLTFTKAAAAEMANRIHGALADWVRLADPALADTLTALAGSPPDAPALARARRLFAEVLDLPGGLKIQTIHSFAESLLSRFPLEANLGPHFRVMDERTQAELLARARDSVLARAADGALSDVMAELAARTGDVNFADLAKALIAARHLLRALLDAEAGADGAVAALYRRLGLAPGEDAAAVLAGAVADGALDGDGLRRAAAAMVQGGKTDAKHGGWIAAWLAADAAGRAAGFDAYRQAFLTQEGAPRKALVHKEALAIDPGAADVLATEAARLTVVEERRKAAASAQATAALLRVGEALLAAYADAKRRRGLLDYDDLILFAGGLLTATGGGWVHYKLDGGIDHVLVDEAQDTSRPQWAVIGALAEEFFHGEGARAEARTLFAVGDVKQSIFGFQGAEPAAFEEMRTRFRALAQGAARDWRDVPLHSSYRSTPAVLAAVDAVFADDGARDGLGADPIAHRPERQGQGGRVELWPIVEPAPAPAPAASWTLPLVQRPGDDPAGRLADRIAALIAGWLDRGEVLESRDRAVRPGDILILVRRREAFFEAIVRALKARGVPVAGSDRMTLTDELAVMDLMALARFLLLPEDDLSLAELLKSPLIGFDEDALFDLAHGRGAAGLWATLVARRDSRPDFAAAHGALAGWRARADFAPPYEFFARVLGADGGRRRLAARLGAEIDDPLDEFLALALDYERTHPPSLQGFLHWLESGQAQIKRDLEQGGDQVRVMTVHGAKGLQAPVVFLPDTCRAPADTPAFHWLARGGDAARPPVFYWPGKKSLHGRDAAAAVAAAARDRDREYRRLLYVAMTRAEDRLYVAGYAGRRARGEGSWYDLVQRALAPIAAPAATTFADGPETVLRFALPRDAAPDRTAAPAAPDAVEAALPGWAQAPAPPEPEPARPLVPSRPDEDEPALSSPVAGGGGDAFRRGRLIHRLLQTLPDLAPEARADAARRFLARPVHDLDAAARAEIADSVLGLVADPRFADLFAPGGRAEVAVTGQVGGRVVAGQVDRLVVDPDAVLVADFKTNRRVPEDIGAVPAVYLRQMAAYRALLSAIYPDRPVRCLLVWTQGPRLMELPNAALAPHAP